MSITQNCDVLIIGGGPAGSSAAAILARQGYHVVILEKAHHPRNSVGESLIPHFWKYADAVGVSERIEKEGFIQKSGGTVAWNGVIRQFSFKDFGYTRPALHVERDRFDQILLDHARQCGAQIHEGIVVHHADLSPDHSTVHYRCVKERIEGKITARMVLDASGQAGVLSRQMETRRLDTDFRFVSIWGYFTGASFVGAKGRILGPDKIRQEPPTTFLSSVDAPGWCWHIPLRESTSVGLVLPVNIVKEANLNRDRLEACFLERCYGVKYLDRLLDGASLTGSGVQMIRDYSYRVTPQSGPGYFALGDACGFVDPIFSLGVVMAMFTGTASAWAVDQIFKHPDRAEHYQGLYNHLFSSRQELARSLTLPGKRPAGETDDQHRRVLGFNGKREQELIQVISLLTNRSDNFHRSGGLSGLDTTGKFQELSDLVTA